MYRFVDLPAGTVARPTKFQPVQLGFGCQVSGVRTLSCYRAPAWNTPVMEQEFPYIRQLPGFQVRSQSSHMNFHESSFFFIKLATTAVIPGPDT